MKWIINPGWFFLLILGGQTGYAQTAKKVAIGTTSTGDSVQLKLVGRIQNMDPKPASRFDIFDKYILSPKSALILNKTINGQTSKYLYINNLEGGITTIYNINKNFAKAGEIKHRFYAKDAALFKETNFPGYTYKTKSGKLNEFMGKPVEMALSNNGKYLWIPYYRRDYDPNATDPSAMALISVKTNKIIRVFPTAPLPKVVAGSPDNRYLAITNWGNNTVHLMDISSGDPAQFHYAAHFVVDYQLNLNFNKAVIDRDVECGLCLRGTLFTPDSKFLFVGRNGGGGIAVFSMADKKYLGTIFGTTNDVRHMVISGDYIYLSSNTDGMVSKTNWRTMLTTFLSDPKNCYYTNWQIAFTGCGARTIDLTNDGAYLFASVNDDSKVCIIRTADMQITGVIDADSFPVGMTIDSDNKYLVVTAQGKNKQGGNSVMIYEIIRK